MSIQKLQANNLTLFRGDCLSVIPAIEGKFDTLITDPPYSSGGKSMGDRARSTGDKYIQTGKVKHPDFLGDNKDQRSFLHWCALWMSLCYEKMNDGGLAVIFTDWRQLPVTTDALQAAGFTWRGVAVWDKTGAARPYKGGYRSQAEYVVWGSKGALTGDKYADGLFRVSPRAEEKLHQVGKPIALMESLLTVAGQHVFDPFMGSGSTGIAALQLGKQFTGVEMDPHYFEVTAERFRAAGHSLL